MGDRAAGARFTDLALAAAAVCAGAAIALFIGSGAAEMALLRLTRRFAL